MWRNKAGEKQCIVFYNKHNEISDILQSIKQMIDETKESAFVSRLLCVMMTRKMQRVYTVACDDR